jgi:ATP-binding cassette subfamily F protein uup
MPFITLDNASLAFGHHALLDHAAFQLDAGERVGLIWPQRRRQIQLIKSHSRHHQIG